MSSWLPELLSSPDHENARRRLPRLNRVGSFYLQVMHILDYLKNDF